MVKAYIVFIFNYIPLRYIYTLSKNKSKVYKFIITEYFEKNKTCNSLLVTDNTKLMKLNHYYKI